MNFNDYDGKSLNAQIEIELRKTSQTTQADYITEACIALGFKKRKRSDVGNCAENVAIMNWLREHKTVHKNKPVNRLQIVLPDEPTTIETVLQKKQLKQYAGKYLFKSIAVNTGSGTDRTRHVIKLDRFYIDALESIGITKVAAWLSATVAKEWNETTGDKSIAKIVKAAIVSELVRRATQS